MSGRTYSTEDVDVQQLEEWHQRHNAMELDGLHICINDCEDTGIRTDTFFLYVNVVHGSKHVISNHLDKCKHNQHLQCSFDNRRRCGKLHTV